MPHRVAVATRTLFDAIDRAHTLKLISVAVFAGAAAWAAGRGQAVTLRAARVPAPAIRR